MRFSFWKKSIYTFLVALAGLPVLVFARTGNDPKILQPAYEQAGVYKAWDYATGSSDVVVAVIDNGFDTFHPDLFQNVWKNTKEVANNGIDDDRNGYVDDVWGWSFLAQDKNGDGGIDAKEREGDNNPQPDVSHLGAEERKDALFNHGTFVAGIIGSIGNNGRDGAGLNWRVKLMNIRVLGNNGYGELSPLGKAIRYAVDNGAHVINISMVGDKDDATAAAIRYAYEKGVVVVAAMGNYGGNLNNNLMYPACADADSTTTMVLGVSAVGADRRLAYFSNTGSKCVDITAPGVDIGSTVRYSPVDGFNETYVRGWQGTSFAAPFVAGTAALIKSIRPEWKAPQIYQAILSTTHHTPSDDEIAYAQAYGKGLLQVHRAVAYAMGLNIPPTMFQTSTPDVVNTTTLFAVLPTHQKTFSVVSPTGELRDGYADKSEMGGWYERPEAKNIESLSAVGVGQDQKIVTARIKNKNERLITVYNSKWQEETSWIVPVKGPVFVSAFERPIGLSIAVSPLTANTHVYWLYNAAGELMESVAQKTVHDGVRVLGDKDGVYAIVANKNTVELFVYKEGGLPSAQFKLPAYTKLPSAALGDLIGDGKSEIVLGEANEVSLYTLDGLVIRSFSPFGDGRPGVHVALFDADRNGSTDIVTIPINTSNVVRAWTARAKPVGEWAMPSTITSLFLLPRK